MQNVARQLIEEYNAFMDALIERELLLDANPLEVAEHVERDEHGKSRRFSSLMWSGSSGLSYLFSDYASIEQYQEVIKRRDFCFCLADGSIIQMHYRFEDEEITYHRLCFLPCPFAYSREDFGDIGLAEVPDMMSAGDFISMARLNTPLRFDYDRDFSDEKHAHSHFTLNRTSCRIPTYGPISIGHFMSFVFRYFFEDDFDEPGWWPNVRPRVISKTLGYPRPHEFNLDSSIDFD